MTVDVAAFIGEYPYRTVAPGTPRHLLGEMDRVGIDRAWVGDVGAFLYRDPRPANRRLTRELAPYADRLRPVPTIHPGLPGWEDDVEDARGSAAAAIRVYPQHQGLDSAGKEMRSLMAAAAGARLPVLLTVRFEDVRQRHPLDITPDLPAAAVRALARSHQGAKLVVTHAERSFVEEVHFGLTPAEAERVVWDVSWVWGPPEDHLALLLETVGRDRFVFGTGMPLRIPDATVAKLELLPVDESVREAIRTGNLVRWLES